MSEAEIGARLECLKEKVAAAARRAGRDPSAVSVVAVSKTVDVEQIRDAIAAGIEHVGENRIQEASEKFERIGKAPCGKAVTWHMVGHLQTNKVRRALEIFDVIQSVDSMKLARALDERARDVHRTVDALVEVNTSGEVTKYGFVPGEVCEALKQICVLQNLRIKGLMTVGPLVDEPEEARGAFALLRELRDEASALRLPNVEMEVLSMGMTGDFEVAIEEGATMIRVGTAIFGARGR
ncbi:MAG: YggS family pyridoxal phosphate-dependent enzyme [Candidatus Eisenbacteria bacterium]